MKQRELGRTGIKVGEIGLGAWQLGSGAWGPLDEETAIRMVHRSIDLGSNFIDTAPGYGGGKSETVLGKALQGKRDHVVLCSKFGHTAEGDSDFSAEALPHRIDESLQRLQTSYLDVVLLHNPPQEHLSGEGSPLYDALERLQSDGKIRTYGVSIDSKADMETVIRTTNSGALEVLFNALHQETRGAFAEAAERGVGLIVKVPLDSGWLSGKYDSNSRFMGVRDRWNPAQISRRAELVEKLKGLLPPELSLRDAALQFILAHPEVSTIIPGARTIEQVDQNCRAGDHVISLEIVSAIRSLWASEIQDSPVPW